MHRFHGFQAAECCADIDPHTLSLGVSDVQAGVLHGLLTGGQGKLHKAVGAANVAFIEVVLGDKAPCLAGNLYQEVGGVESGDGVNTRDPATELFPDGVEVYPKRRDGSEPRNDDTSIQESPP